MDLTVGFGFEKCLSGVIDERLQGWVLGLGRLPVCFKFEGVRDVPVLLLRVGHVEFDT